MGIVGKYMGLNSSGDIYRMNTITGELEIKNSSKLITLGMAERKGGWRKVD